MSPALVTRFLLVAVIVVLAGWTTAMTVMRNFSATVSHNVLACSLKAPVLVLALGVLLGHWLYPRYPGHGDWLFTLIHRYPVLLLPVGIFLGRLFWSQEP